MIETINGLRNRLINWKEAFEGFEGFNVNLEKKIYQVWWIVVWKEI